jgi:hypothetical protein
MENVTDFISKGFLIFASYTWRRFEASFHEPSLRKKIAFRLHMDNEDLI